jgi:hypothetical protein
VTSSGLEPAQYLNQVRYRVPPYIYVRVFLNYVGRSSIKVNSFECRKRLHFSGRETGLEWQRDETYHCLVLNGSQSNQEYIPVPTRSCTKLLAFFLKLYRYFQKHLIRIVKVSSTRLNNFNELFLFCAAPQNGCTWTGLVNLIAQPPDTIQYCVRVVGRPMMHEGTLHGHCFLNVDYIVLHAYV